MESTITTLTAADFMTTDVLTAPADWPINRLAEFLTEEAISGAPVVSEEGALLGVVSLTDIVRHDSLPEKEPPSHKPHTYYLHTLDHAFAEEELSTFMIHKDTRVRVRDIMTPVVFSTEEDTLIGQIASMMRRGRIHRVFVTREDRVVGVISSLDLLKVVEERF